jgi:VCBS repeat-containing protein
MAKPKLNHQLVNFSEGAGSYTGNVLSGASDADGDTITVARVNDDLVGGAIGGNKAVNEFVGKYGTLVIAENGSYTYTLNEGVDIPAGQQAVESFKIKVRDGTGNHDQAYLKFAVTGESNRAPIAGNDPYRFDSDFVSGNVLNNDRDPDGDTLFVAHVIRPSTGESQHITGRGTVAIEGTYGTLFIDDTGAFTYQVNMSDPDTIAAGFAATEKFAYKPHDGRNSEGNNTDYAHLTFKFDASDVALV